MQTLFQIQDKQLTVLSCEKQFILHPMIFGILPVWKDSSPFDFTFDVKLENYKITLERMWVMADCVLPIINGIHPRKELHDSKDGVMYDKIKVPIQYSGAILLAHTIVKDYDLEPDENGLYPCYCYKVLYEYIFENGILITTIDHSRAMLRIRKNLDLGYRDLKKKRDRRCIEKFVKTSLVGEYKKNRSIKKQEEYLSDMRKQYKENPNIQVEVNIE